MTTKTNHVLTREQVLDVARPLLFDAEGNCITVTIEIAEQFANHIYQLGLTQGRLNGLNEAAVIAEETECSYHNEHIDIFDEATNKCASSIRQRGEK